jgi:hypothetical protein
MRIEVGVAGGTRDRRGPLPLNIADSVLDTRLLGRRPGHAEARREHIVTGQRREAWVQGAFTPAMDVDRDGLGVVPPQLAWNTAEEVERLDEAVENGLGTLGGQRDGEGAVGVTPGRDQHGHLPTTIGEVHVDVSEVSFEPPAGRVVERDERLTSVATALLKVSLDGQVAAGVVVFGDESAEDLRGGVPLLGRCGLILREDVVNDGPHGIEDGSRSRLGHCIGRGLRVTQRLENGLG